MAGFGRSIQSQKKEQASKNGPLFLEKAVRAHQAGELKKAEALYLKAINSGFQHEIAFSNLAVIYKNTERQREAVLIYKRAISANPNFADAYSNLGNLLREIGELDEALSSTLKSLELNAKNPTTLINLGSIYNDLDDVDQAISSTIQSIEIKANNNFEAYDNLTNMLQRPKPTLNTNPRNQIEAIDVELRKLKIPGTEKSSISLKDVDNFIRNALEIASPLESTFTSSLTQIFHKSNSTEPNCKKFKSFFAKHNSIAQRCHDCYKVEIGVESLDELLILNFLMKSIQLSENNTRKCMIELRKQSSGFFKGLIFCSSIDEAKKVLAEVDKDIQLRTDLKPTFRVKRGCTEFTNVHKQYGDIGHTSNLHEGPSQPKEWKANEDKFLSTEENAIKSNPMGWEFNLGELAIIKNWILYAIAINDSTSLSKYDYISYDNNALLKLIAEQHSQE